MLFIFLCFFLLLLQSYGDFCLVPTCFMFFFLLCSDTQRVLRQKCVKGPNSVVKKRADSSQSLSVTLPSYLLHLPSYIVIGPCPIHDVVVMAVRKAVRAATTTFTATSTIRLVFIIPHFLNNSSFSQ